MDNWEKLRLLRDQNNTIVPFRYIESMTLINADPMDQVIDKLSNRVIIKCRTISGSTHIVDVIQNVKCLADYDPNWDINTLYAIIVESWFKYLPN
jgi:hypothetical protein